MIRIEYEGTSYDLPENETILDSLLAQGMAIPNGCRSGTCQSCLLRCIAGDIPPDSQKGLKESLVLTGHLLACQCYPQAPMHLFAPASDGRKISAKVQQRNRVTPDILAVSLKPKTAFTYRPGQFIRIYNPEGIARSYSLASVDSLDDDLVLHIRAYPNGLLSTWIHQTVQVGDELLISEPLGNCFYIPGKPLQPLLLIGTGSGLAPLYGILRDALNQGHVGPIHLYHGARHLEDLYLQTELRELEDAHSNFRYIPCVSGPQTQPTPNISIGRASEVALRDHPDLKGWEIYLCGNPEMVRSTQMLAYLAGAALDAIHADPFDAQIQTVTPSG